MSDLTTAEPTRPVPPLTTIGGSLAAVAMLAIAAKICALLIGREEVRERESADEPVRLFARTDDTVALLTVLCVAPGHLPVTRTLARCT